MAFGVLEPSSPGAVPATVILDERAQDGIASLSSLKRSGEVQVVLVPQPTDDPNDPLNWTQFEKYVVFLILCMGSLSITVTPVTLLYLLCQCLGNAYISTDRVTLATTSQRRSPRDSG